MIHDAISLIRQELVAYLEAEHGYGNAGDIVLIENIALFESTGTGVNFDDKIVMSLVNIEEESTLKNSAFVKQGIGANARYENPPIFINLYLLITASNKSTAEKSYLNAIERLSLVIRFFQGKNTFTAGSSAFYSSASFTAEDYQDLRITAELYTLTFEQINHLWGTLGGKQMPSAMYKLRLVAITDHKLLREVPLIEEIETTVGRRPGKS